MFHCSGYFCDFVVMFFVDVASFCLPMSIHFRVSSNLFERAEVIVLLVLVRYDIKLDVRDDGKLLPLILPSLFLWFRFSFEVAVLLFDREWLMIILPDRGLFVPHVKLLLGRIEGFRWFYVRVDYAIISICLIDRPHIYFARCSME